MINLIKLCLVASICCISSCAVNNGTGIKRGSGQHADSKFVQVKTMSKIIVFEKEVPHSVARNLKEKGAQYTDREVLLLFRAMASLKGCKVHTAPSIVTRDGESATIEIIRELPMNGRQLKTWKYPWLGHYLKLKSTISGEIIHTKMKYAYHYAQGMGNADLGDFEGVDYSKKVNIQEFETSRKLSLKDAMSQVIKLEAPEGEVRYLVFTQELIDVTGQPIKGFNSLDNRPNPCARFKGCK